MKNQNQQRQEMHKICTFVMFDTETTGLPSPGNNPRITELCFVAISREELMTRQQAPRVLNKLLMCFNPMRKIDHGAAEVSGIYNDAVESMPPFKKQAQLLCHFLQNLPQPACLIAHYGNGFDFPLLVSELYAAKEEIPDVVCADSFEAFRMLDGLPRVPEFIQKERNKKAQAFTKARDTKQLFPEGRNATNEDVTANKTMGQDEKQGTELKETSQQISPEYQQEQEVIKPEAPIQASDQHKESKFSPQTSKCWNVSEITPKLSVPEASPQNSKGKRTHAESLEFPGTVKRQLFSDPIDNKGETAAYGNNTELLIKVECTSSFLEDLKNEAKYESSFSNLSDSKNFTHNDTNAREIIPTCTQVSGDQGNVASEQDPLQVTKQANTISKPDNVAPSNHGSYKLKSVYARTFNQELPNAHTAEGDCLALLKIIQNKSVSFLPWCDQHAVPLGEIFSMY